MSEDPSVGRRKVSEEIQHEERYVNSLSERFLYTSRARCSVALKSQEMAMPRPIPNLNAKRMISREAYSSERSTSIDSTDAFDEGNLSVGGGDSYSLKSSMLVIGLGGFKMDSDASGCMSPSFERSSFGTASEPEVDGSWSQGSVGHPHLCERSCSYAAAGQCYNGASCRYCHAPHTGRQLQLDKRHRSMLQAMSFELKTEVMFPILEQKAVEHDFGPSCQDLLNLLERQVGLAHGHRHVPIKMKGRRGLVRTLSSMYFFDVLRHLLSSRALPEVVSKNVRSLMEGMRLYAARKAEG